MTGHDPNNYLTRIPLSKYFFGINSPIFKNLNIGQILGKTFITTPDFTNNPIMTYARKTNDNEMCTYWTT